MIVLLITTNDTYEFSVGQDSDIVFNEKITLRPFNETIQLESKEFQGRTLIIKKNPSVNVEDNYAGAVKLKLHLYKMIQLLRPKSYYQLIMKEFFHRKLTFVLLFCIVYLYHLQ